MKRNVMMKERSKGVVFPRRIQFAQKPSCNRSNLTLHSARGPKDVEITNLLPINDLRGKNARSNKFYARVIVTREDAFFPNGKGRVTDLMHGLAPRE